ncbi:MAG: carbohydrate kinase [Thermonema sp.]|uniref:bifunctional heptose 7-phosphate kinase/heptose 1-phosphate adenyltransferase n=1 Tax=Thermonema sp. TaxID=2231181 RepID=UPI0021DC5153|nr:bifunctional ADP-heptose synthase [Thermonema sp.]GIV39874.1 MAG: carbohydrate kinase [Thermonema sp.]
MNKQKVEALFERFRGLRVLIVGDVMIDSYLWGQATRISPEAPVPVVNVKKREWRLGGAANVALNVKALGAEAILCGVLGNDAEAARFLSLMEEEGLNTSGLLQVDDRPTTIKHRIIAGSQQLLRVDAEEDRPLNEVQTGQFRAQIAPLLRQADVVIFEDYDKGCLTPELIQWVVSEAHKRGIKVTVDPKKRNFFAYTAVDLFKPNLKELKEAMLAEVEPLSPAFKEVVAQLRQRLQATHLMTTLSEKGVYWQSAEGEWHVPAHVRSIADVSGAGDTVIAVASLCLALGLPPYPTAALANLAGGIVCEYPGVVPVPRARFMEEAARQAAVWEQVAISN